MCKPNDLNNCIEEEEEEEYEEETIVTDHEEAAASSITNNNSENDLVNLLQQLIYQNNEILKELKHTNEVFKQIKEILSKPFADQTDPI